MAQHKMEATRLIQAPAAKIYNIIADYRTGHPHILPRPYFPSLSVEQGGVGAGTVIDFEMQLMGKKRVFRATISEPVPGRVLVETDPEAGTVTTFRVEPSDQGDMVRVTITTQFTTLDGIFGAMQGWLMIKMLQPIYIKELDLLGEFAVK